MCNFIEKIYISVNFLKSGHFAMFSFHKNKNSLQIIFKSALGCSVGNTDKSIFCITKLLLINSNFKK